VKQPIPANTFLHYCKHHKTTQSSVWVSRLPKRLRQRLFEVRISSPSVEYVPGWGVYIIEGPNWKDISRLGAMVVTASLLISVVYTSIRKDASSGFAIGAFITTIWMAWMTAFYYQWQE
jgi:hypothetical protein